jgi:CubicO group peptidase (beta-lactamase class C family)
MKEMPGRKYEYQSVSAQLLGLIIQKATGKSLADYLSEKIWKPLQMEKEARWSTDEKGNEKAFCCIHATARDFAKIGQLILQKGHWNGKQMISEDFVQKMLSPTEENSAFGYCIWADDESLNKYRFFYGFLGQFIIMIPEQEIVIVKTGLYNRLEVDEKKRPLQVKILAEEVLRSLANHSEETHQISLSMQDLAAKNIVSASS